jgi:hypothetical protein
VIVYTAIFGDYDRPPKAPFSGQYPHILFTDKKVTAPGWEVRVMKRAFANPARENRYYKLQPHVVLPDAVKVLYHDGSMGLTKSPADILRAFEEQAGGTHDVFTLAHSLGHTRVNEYKWVHMKRMTDDRVLRKQASRYDELGVPPDMPTAEPRLIISHLTPRTKEFFSAWWSEVAVYTHRDQVSFPYAAWVTRPDVHLVPFFFARSFFTIKPHAKRQLVNAR